MGKIVIPNKPNTNKKGNQPMKHFICLIVSLFIFTIDCIAQSVGLGNTDPSVFSNYKLPDISYHSLWLGSNFSFYSNKQINKYEGDPDRYNYRSELSLSPSYSILKQTDDSKLSISNSVSGNYYNEFRITEGNGFNQGSRYKALSYGLNLSSMINYDNYFSGSNYFHTLGTSLFVRLNEAKYGNEDLTGNKSQGYNFYAGIGWGKIRMITPVVSAIRLQERLKQINILNRDLNQTTIEKVAQEFSNANIISRSFVRSDKYLWERIEKALSAEGVSLSGLNQFGNSFIREIPGELRFERHEGIQAGYRFQLEYWSNYSSQMGRSWISESLFLMNNFYFNYSHQLGLYSQASFNLSLEMGPSINKPNNTKQRYQLTYNINYAHELTDRFIFTAHHKLGLQFDNMNTQIRWVNAYVVLSGSYFVEDNISLTASYELRYDDSTYSDFQRWTGIDNKLNIGITYYFDRGILFR